MLRRTTGGATALILVVGVLAGSAAAIDQPIGGTQLALRRFGNGGALTLVLRDATLAVPQPGGSDDPSTTGLTVTLFGRSSGERATLAAPAGLGRPGWNVRAAPRITDGYAMPSAPPGSAQLHLVSLRDGAGLRLRARSAGLALAVPEQAIAVRVEWGSTRVCALFTGAAVRRDQVGWFLARDAAVAGLHDCNDDTLAATPCGESATCGGTCPGDASCGGDPHDGGCFCVSPHQACGGTAPVCNGECPSGEECANIGGVPSPSCGCLPTGSTPCGGVYPSCGDGDCPAGTSCMIDTFTCCGGVTINGCVCSSGPPPPLCPGGCPTDWSCVVAPGQGAMCLPPFCSGGSGAPVCDGTCSQPGAECTTISTLCLCVTPCSGGDAYPSCGGTCADLGSSCQPAVGNCLCLP